MIKFIHDFYSGIKKDELKRALNVYKENSVNPSIPNIEYDELATDLGFRLPSIMVNELSYSIKKKLHFKRQNENRYLFLKQ